MRGLIITGDDFGLAVPVNEAIEESHRRGILSTASLMVNGAAAEDATSRARGLPSLRVGLHVVVVEGKSVLPPAELPDLVDANGEFMCRLVRAGVRYFFQPRVRKQLEAEIRAQFEAFSRTGLELDHVNAHNHMHLHPTILSLILKVGRNYGLRAVRLPYEPPLPSWRATKRALASKIAWWFFLWPWLHLMKLRLRRARIHCNDHVFGVADSGRMTTDLVIAFLRELPLGVTEMYFHPATRRCPEIDRTMPDYQHEEEFRALTDRSVREELLWRGIQQLTYRDI